MNEDLVNRFERAIDRMGRINYVESQIMCAKAELQGMLVLNAERLAENKALAYDEQAFIDLIDKYGISHKTVLEQTL